MSVDRILIDASPGETRVALMAGERLCELWIERAGEGTLAGNVYLGRVEKVVPGIAAAFVDIGLERSGFLGLAEARPPLAAGETPEDRITDHLSEGDAVLVQVQRDPAADKGAKLTTHVALTGRYAVLLPGSTEIHLSRRIDGKAERDRLQDVVRETLRPGEGIILRTNAAGARTGDLEADIERLRANLGGDRRARQIRQGTGPDPRRAGCRPPRPARRGERRPARDRGFGRAAARRTAPGVRQGIGPVARP